jgi:hypothetical protein
MLSMENPLLEILDRNYKLVLCGIHHTNLYSEHYDSTLRSRLYNIMETIRWSGFDFIRSSLFLSILHNTKIK